MVYKIKATFKYISCHVVMTTANDDVMSVTQTESHCNLKLQSFVLGKRMNLR